VKKLPPSKGSPTGARGTRAAGRKGIGTLMTHACCLRRDLICTTFEKGGGYFPPEGATQGKKGGEIGLAGRELS